MPLTHDPLRVHEIGRVDEGVAACMATPAMAALSVAAQPFVAAAARVLALDNARCAPEGRWRLSDIAPLLADPLVRAEVAAHGPLAPLDDLERRLEASPAAGTQAAAEASECAARLAHDIAVAITEQERAARERFARDERLPDRPLRPPITRRSPTGSPPAAGGTPAEDTLTRRRT